MSQLFTEEKYNAMMQALEECAKDRNETIYQFFRDLSYITAVSLLVDKLEELGYQITKKQ